jgi:hypothetical protein
MMEREEERAELLSCSSSSDVDAGTLELSTAFLHLNILCI